MSTISPSGLELVDDCDLRVNDLVDDFLIGTFCENCWHGTRCLMVGESLPVPVHLVHDFRGLGGEASLESNVVQDCLLLVQNGAVILVEDRQSSSFGIDTRSLYDFPLIKGDFGVLKSHTCVGK